jgi:Ala-tRNA(Pro) deacylase
MSIAESAGTYDRVMNLLEEHGVQYQVIDHLPEGRTDAASALRGHPSSQAAKCMVIEVRVERHALCVIPGNMRVDLEAVRRLYGGTRARLAPVDVAEELTGCQQGTIVPFSFRPEELDLLADPALLEKDQLYFNAARLDRSLAISASDFAYVAGPRMRCIAKRAQL